MMTIDPRGPEKSTMGLSFMWKQYQTNEMVAMLYKASHRKGNESAKQWLQQTKLQLERLSCHQQGNRSCKTVEAYLKSSLWNFIEAVGKFEALYKSNCPMAGVFPSPMIKGLNRMTEQAKLALLYIEV